MWKKRKGLIISTSGSIRQVKNLRSGAAGSATGSKVPGILRGPWLELTFLGHGHTIPFDGIPGYDYLLFLNSNEIKDIDAPVYNDFMGERINLLWLRPITEEEYAFEVENGVSAYLEGKDLTTIHIF